MSERVIIVLTIIRRDSLGNKIMGPCACVRHKFNYGQRIIRVILMRSKRKKVKTIFVVKSLRKKGLKCNRQIINGLKNQKDDTNNKRFFFSILLRLN